MTGQTGTQTTVSGDTVVQALLSETADRAGRYLAGLEGRSVGVDAAALAELRRLDEPFPDGPTEDGAVLALLDEIGSPATTATASRRFFGFVIGGSLPVALAANWLATAWDQNAALTVTSPIAAKVEEVALGWLTDIFGLPAGTGGAFVTGATMANFTALAAARHRVLADAGWNVEADGLFGAPPINMVVSDESHISVFKALTLLGFGRERVIRVPVDSHGRLRPDSLPALDGPTIVCAQAGNINTGAMDPVGEICAWARGNGAWVHVDGAFGMWAAASPTRSHLVAGITDADSWTIDTHKWLNVPYDSGIALVRDGESLRAAMSVSASYLTTGDAREPSHYVPEISRRSRGVDVWAALRSLGRDGLADLIDRCCRYASRFADGLREAGYEILNEVELNQVLVRFGDDETTRRVIAGIQADGTCWCGGTVWQGQTAMRISVSSWATTAEDIELSLAAMLRVAQEVENNSREITS